MPKRDAGSREKKRQWVWPNEGLLVCLELLWKERLLVLLLLFLLLLLCGRCLRGSRGTQA